MITLMTLTNNNEYADRVAVFCERENMKHVIAQSLSEITTNTAALLLTDYKLTKEEISVIPMPACIIDDEIAFPFHFHLQTKFSDVSLRFLLDSVLHEIQAKVYEHAISPVKIDKEYVVRGEFYDIDRVVHTITRDLIYFFTFSELEKIRTGISEILTNAIEHGNLNISGEEKQEATENSTYYELINERMKVEEYAKRIVKLAIKYDQDELTVKICDEGKGFDTNDLPDPTSPDALLKLHGRGVFISKMYFDELTYNEKGNEATLYKKRK